MRLFLDASVLLASAGSNQGASRALFSYAATHSWDLIASPYVLTEVQHNLPRLPPTAIAAWDDLRKQLTLVDDVLSSDRPLLFSASKDRPVLLSALASADVLLTLDRSDFAEVLGNTVYGMPVLLPYDFLRLEREAGRLP